MANDLILYIGHDETEIPFNRESKQWQEVKDQIVDAMNAGRGLITIPRAGAGRQVFVYSPSFPIRWVEHKD